MLDFYTPNCFIHKGIKRSPISQTSSASRRLFIIFGTFRDLELEPCLLFFFRFAHIKSASIKPVHIDKSLFSLSPGDVVLKNLILKQSALSELDLPVQTTYGHLGSLVLKIPWKNLYSAPVEAYIDRLYLLAVPNSSVRYNEEREEKFALDSKKSELDRIQLAKKLEQEKSK